MNVDIDQIMRHPLVTAAPQHSAGQVRELMTEHRVSAMPVVNTDGEPIGVVTAADFLVDRAADAPVSSFMSSPVYTVARYDGPHVAARIMRNHHLHHVIVTEHKVAVGIVSAYDLLQLVEDHRFTAKQGPTPSKKAKGRS